jgi:hypothetical protein
MQKFLSLILVVFSFSVNAQITYDGPAEGFVSDGITLNTNEFSFNNFSYQEFIFLNELEPESNYQDFVFPDSSYPERNFYYLQSNSNNLSDSLIISQSFEGIPETNYYPPDDYIAAGPNHLVMVVNNLFRIYDKSGNIQKTINAAVWYSTLVSGAAPVDPKILYDPFDKRWVMVWIMVDFVQFRSFYIISVSDDDDPNGIWFNWALPLDVNGNTPSNNWGDYEGVGFDDTAIYLTTNQFSFSSVYDYVKIRIIDKNYIYINSNPGIVRWKDIWNITLPGNSNSAFNLRPTRMYNTSNEFYLFYLPSAGGNFCVVYEIQNTVTNPVLTAIGYPITAFKIAPHARQLGGNLRIYGGLSNLGNEPVFQDGILHAVHSIKNPNDTSLSSLHYLAIDPVNNIVSKDIAMGDDEHFFFYPALAVDKNNNVIISYSRSSTNEYAGGFFTIIPKQSGVPTSSIKLKEGNAYYDKRNSAGRNRWGDYSGAWIDPVDSSSFWICTEYVEALNTWGTWIGEVKYDYVIPVELVSFDIKTENGNVVLNWEVSSELNNHGYIINRWITADSIYQIGFVEGKVTTTEKQFYSFIDKKVNNNRYHYQLVQIDFNGTKNILAQIAINMSSAINSFTLSHNYPNPFNPSTKIKYQIPKLSYVILKVYDVLGNEITILVNEDKSIGSYEEEFDGSGLPSGVYIYKLQAGSFVETKKMVLMK